MPPADEKEEQEQQQQEQQISAEEGRLGDVLLAREVARREQVDIKTVERWIAKGLPASKATGSQIAELFARGLITAVPPHGTVYLIREADLRLIPGIRAYPKNRKKPERRGGNTAARSPQGPLG